MRTLGLAIILAMACGGSSVADPSAIAPGCSPLFGSWRQVGVHPVGMNGVAPTELTLSGPFGANQTASTVGRFDSGPNAFAGTCSFAADVEKNSGFPDQGTVTLSAASPNSADCAANAVASNYTLLCDALIIENQYGTATYTTP